MKFTVISIITGDFFCFFSLLFLYLALYFHQKVGNRSTIFTSVNFAVSIFGVGFFAAYYYPLVFKDPYYPLCL